MTNLPDHIAKHLSSKQLNSINELRERVSDISSERIKSDVFIWRWLKARDFDLKEAEKMLRNHFAWREENSVDNILETFKIPDVLKKYYPGGFCGKDRDGYPLKFDPTGRMDPKGLFQSVPYDTMIRERIWIMEYILNVLLPKFSEEAGKEIEGVVVIFDLDKFGMRHLWKPAFSSFIEVTKIFEANYPEILHKCFVINAPAVFYVAYNMLKPFLHQNTQEKIFVLNKNYSSELLKHISAEYLPVVYGGKLIDNDGHEDCRQWICYGGAVPASYHLKLDNNSDMFVKKIVDRGSVLYVDIAIDKADNVIQWEFQTEDYDIKFGVCYVEDQAQFQSLKKSSSSSDSEIILPMRKVMSNLTREKGELVCSKIGIYVLKFDNSFSWTKSKSLLYRVEVLDLYNECNT